AAQQPRAVEAAERRDQPAHWRPVAGGPRPSVAAVSREHPPLRGGRAAPFRGGQGGGGVRSNKRREGWAGFQAGRPSRTPPSALRTQACWRRSRYPIPQRVKIRGGSKPRSILLRSDRI